MMLRTWWIRLSSSRSFTPDNAGDQHSLSHWTATPHFLFLELSNTRTLSFVLCNKRQSMFIYFHTEPTHSQFFPIRHLLIPHTHTS